MGCRIILLHFLVTLYFLKKNVVYGMPVSDERFESFLQKVKNDTNCDFPPNVFGGNEHRYKFEICLNNTFKSARQQTNFCERIMNLSEQMCSLTGNKIYVDQSSVLSRVWNESTVNITQRVDQICNFLQPSVNGDCKEDCTDAFHVCDVYYAMKKSVVETFNNRLKEAAGMEKVDSFLHTLNDVFPYPPLGSMHTTGQLTPCLKGAEEMDVDVCDAVKEVAYRIADSGIKVNVDTMLQRMNSPDQEICNKFQTMPEMLLSSEVWLSLHALDSCKAICNDKRLNICYALFLGLHYLKPVEEQGAHLGKDYEDESQHTTRKTYSQNQAIKKNATLDISNYPKDGDLMNEAIKGEETQDESINKLNETQNSLIPTKNQKDDWHNQLQNSLVDINAQTKLHNNKTKNEFTYPEKGIQNNLTNIDDKTVQIKDQQEVRIQSEQITQGDGTQFKPSNLAEGVKNGQTFQVEGTHNEQKNQGKVHYEQTNQTEVVQNAPVNQGVEQNEPINQDVGIQNKSTNQDKGVQDESRNKMQNESSNKAVGLQNNPKIIIEESNEPEGVPNKYVENEPIGVEKVTQHTLSNGVESQNEPSNQVEKIQYVQSDLVDGSQNQNDKAMNYPSSKERTHKPLLTEGDGDQSDVALQGDGAQNHPSNMGVKHQNHEQNQGNKETFTLDGEPQDKAEIGQNKVQTGGQLYELSTETTSSKTKAMKESDVDISSKDEKYGEENKDSSRKRPNSASMQHEEGEENVTGGMGFMSYFLVFTVLCVAGYIVFHNKQKIIALVIEGKNLGNGRRLSSKEYRRLKTEDVMPSLERSTMTANYVY